MTETSSDALQYLQMLKDDPQVVHLAMLRGSIAKPDIRTMLHTHGEKALAQWDRLERMEKALRYYAEGPDGRIAKDALRD